MTVLMPVHNAAAYLAGAIDSILAQTHTDFEFLVIDDGSTDTSPEILADYAARDPRIVLHRTPNQGVTRTLNLGLELASHPLIARMDADDLALPDRLARQLAYIDTHPSCLVLGTAALAIDPDGDPLAYLRYPETPQAIRELLLTPPGRSLVHPSVLFRADAARAVGGYSLDAEYVEDYDLWLRLLEHGDLACLPDVLLHYRIHPSSVSSQRREAQRQAHARVLAEARTRLLLPDPPPPSSPPPTVGDPSKPPPSPKAPTKAAPVRHRREQSEPPLGPPAPTEAANGRHRCERSELPLRQEASTAASASEPLAYLALHNGFPKTARKHARRALLACPRDSSARWLFLESHLGPRLTNFLKSTYLRLRPPSP